jgi:hypothetical protein
VLLSTRFNGRRNRMRISGKALTSRNTKTIEFQRGDEKVEITVCSLPPGYESRITALGFYRDPPKPPLKAKQAASGVYVKGEKGKVEYEEDRTDAKWRAAVTLYNSRLRAMKVCEMLSLDSKIEFETAKPAENTLEAWQAYADSIWAELESTESGLTEAEIAAVIEIGEALESTIDLVAALKDFLPQA